MAQPSSTALPGSGDAEPRAVVGGAATPDEGLPLPRTKLLKNLSARHGVPGRERTRTQSSAFSVSPRPDSPQAAPAMSMPFSAGALSLPASSGASLLVAPEAAGASDVLLPVRKPRSRTRVSGHPTQLMTDPASLFQRGVPASERDPAKLGTLGHRTSVAAPTRFVPLNQALATTDGGGRILTANDTLCRILGYNQSEVTGADVLDFLGAPYRERQRKFLMERENEGGDSEAVLVSGNVVQIMKKDARTAPASLWLKEKRTMSGTRILMWVFEPILENSVTVTILKDVGSWGYIALVQLF